ncbi:hypothetical protein H8B09_06590 [Paenibacillus sp. PR3]|uniref:Uncharacterized protein n=1 Tax=Paenibacillus terricola TaxID=2763503 RepID=A0ABR8MR06_9BACL|nr:hypothetical protein [Paenibacillus terricola]MBD3918417.1 hypothetical protein [Paenibacillus terricola]
MANIESAIDECINYIMWSNPNQDYSRTEDSAPYIGQQVSAEVRVYTDSSGDRKVYVQSNIDIWNNALFQFKRLDGSVYCTGHTTPAKRSWPTGDYDVIDTFWLQVQPSRDPHFGNSPDKDRMIESMEIKLTADCQDYLAGSDWALWVDTDFYLVDFFEYEATATIWAVRNNGDAYLKGLIAELDPIRNEYTATSLKGYGVENILNNNDADRVQFDIQTRNAIKHYQCTESGLKSI